MSLSLDSTSVLAELISSPGVRVVVCAGPGGVGKTTTAAVLARAAARRGRRTLVCTVDPARRLRDALGLARAGERGASASATSTSQAGSALGGEHGEIVRVALTGVPSGGSLDALMLEPSAALVELVRSSVKDRAKQDLVLSTRIYQKITTALPGALEYAAMAKLESLMRPSQSSQRDDKANRYDLIVLDTPPTQHALDFLEAPKRLLDALQSPLLRALLRQRERRGWRLLEAGSVYVLRKLSRFIGTAFLEETLEFLIVFEEALQTLGGRAEHVLSLLRSTETAFVLVTSTDAPSIAETRRLEAKLSSLGLLAAAVVATRVIEPEARLSEVPTAGDLARRLPAELTPQATGPVAEALFRAVSFWGDLASRDRLALEALGERQGTLRALPVVAVPLVTVDGSGRSQGPANASGKPAGRGGATNDAGDIGGDLHDEEGLSRLEGLLVGDRLGKRPLQTAKPA